MLLRERRFLPLFVTQFFGAMNDNVLRNALVVLLTFHAANWTTLRPGMIANLAAGIFVLPLFLFSATAGQLADKFDKARLARLFTLLGIGVVLLAGAAFRLHSVPLLMATLFLQGLNSALFGPIKYAILPQHLKEQELVGGNALVAAGTFVAILLGTVLGTLLAGTRNATDLITLAGLCIAVTGYLASSSIPAAPPPDAELKISLNPFGETWRSMNFARENHSVFLSILGISWFWLYGAMFLAQFPAYTRNVLGGAEGTVTLLLFVFTLGIGCGSMLCERLSSGRVELGLVALGSIGLTLFALDLAWASPGGPLGTVPLATGALLARPGTWRVLADLILLGGFGGLFIVPLYALIQQRGSEQHRARTIGANNVFNALFMVAGALAAGGMLDNGVTIPELFAVGAICNGVIAVFVCFLVPGLSAALRRLLMLRHVA
jgi:MFS family permease